MTSFYAYNFLYDDVPSETYGLKILSFGDGGLFSGVGSPEINILQQRVLRKSKPYFLGRTQETVLEFPLTFGRITPISATDRNLISQWLFGRAGYKKLYILQDDLNGIYFNCLFNSPQPQYIGGVNYAFTSNVICDSPWAYGPERIITGTQGGTINIYNGSTEDDYLYPRLFVSFSHRMGQGEFSIHNHTEDRETIYYTLNSHEELYIDNDLQTISVTDSLFGGPTYPVNRFNKKWLRLLPGKNELEIWTENAMIYYEIRFSERLKIGG